MSSIKEKLYTIIFEHDTPVGKAFDIFLILAVLLSVLGVMLETVDSFYQSHKNLFYQLEWFFTGLFTAELILRVYCAPSKSKYLTSFYGVIDILAVLPTYLSTIMPGAQAFLILRAMRLMRVFRILKLSNYTSAGAQLKEALVASRPKITVFVFFVVTMVSILGAAMYYVEGSENGFTSIPTSIYWAIVTMTTVGYGDITPSTTVGQILSSLLMIVGYGVIAVPTGIISTEMARIRNEEDQESARPETCPVCGRPTEQDP